MDFFDEEAGDDGFFDDMADMDGPEMAAEMKAFERVGPSGKLAELLTGANIPDINDLQGFKKKLAKESVSPEDRFLIFTDAIARKINAEGIIPVTEADINVMLEKTSMISGLRYKNPTAYILGYLASEGGRSLKVDRVDFVIKRVLPKISEGGIEPPDVIRYARFWREFL